MNLKFKNLDSTHPGSYVSFIGSPASSGKLQFDFGMLLQRYNWNHLKDDVVINVS